MTQCRGPNCSPHTGRKVPTWSPIGPSPMVGQPSVRSKPVDVRADVVTHLATTREGTLPSGPGVIWNPPPPLYVRQVGEPTARLSPFGDLPNYKVPDYVPAVGPVWPRRRGF